MSGNKENAYGKRFGSYPNSGKQKFVPEKSKESDYFIEDEQSMLNIGEFSPNNPKMRVSTQPYLGLGEYDHRRQMLNDQRKAEYQQYSEKAKRSNPNTDYESSYIKSNFKGSIPVSHSSHSYSADKSVQTDIQDVNIQLVQYEAAPNQTGIEKERSPRNRGAQVQVQTQNNSTEPPTGYSKYVNRVGVALSSSPRAKLMADLQGSCFPPVMSYGHRNTVDEDRFLKVQRQEKYLAELQQQVKEKQMLLKKHKEEEKHEEDLEVMRMKTQLRNLHVDKKEGFGRHCYSSDLPTAINIVNTHEYDNKSDQTYNRNNRMNEKRLKFRTIDSRATHYSDINTSNYTRTNTPPLLKCNKPPYSFNIPPNSVFANSVPVKKRNSKLVLNINNCNITSKNNHSRLKYANTNKLEESLPIPVLKAQSPVAKELINALPIQSRTSDAMRKLEDKWQIPAVQKNIIKTSDRPIEGNNQGVLTQLGAIRLQLQQEQLRLDETLRKRGTSQSQQTLIHADIHHNFN